MTGHVTASGVGDIGVFYETIADNIIRLRGKMSQEELAKKAKVARGTLANAENGKGCSLRALFKIAEALGAKPGDLCVPKEKRDELSMMAALFVERIMEYLPQKLKDEIKK
jgi:transcriptional regulator with XRE-family HTH domain